MFALLGANGLEAEMESDESELALQQDTAELMLTYAKICCRSPLASWGRNTCYIQYRSPTSLYSR